MRINRLLAVILTLCLLTVGCSSTKTSQSSNSDSPASSRVVEQPVTEAPGVSLLGDGVVTLEAGAVFDDPGVEVEDGSPFTVSGALDTGKVGEYKIVYTVGEGDKANSVKRIVRIVDTKAPTIKLNGKSEMTVSARHMYSEPGVTVTDNSSASPKVSTVKSDVKNDSFTVTYTATDASGNKSTAKRTVKIKDIVKPTIKLTGSSDMYVLRDTEYAEPGFSATDDLDGNVTSSVKVSGSVNTAVTGAYTLNYTVTDKSGNTAVVKRIVHIYSQQSDCPDRVYLTFDDGPTSSITPQVLDALKRNNVKATFFILNYSDSRKALVKRIVDEGHTLAIHAYSHDYKACYSSADAYMQGLEKMRAKILADTGYDARIIRFPGGTSNGISKSYCKGVMTELARRTVEAGYSYFDWNIDSGDASGSNVSSKTIYNNVKKGLRRGRNNVVLMHDAAYKSSTVAALDDIINYCKANGYAVLPITTDTVPVRHKPNN